MVIGEIKDISSYLPLLAHTHTTICFCNGNFKSKRSSHQIWYIFLKCHQGICKQCIFWKDQFSKLQKMHLLKRSGAFVNFKQYIFRKDQEFSVLYTYGVIFTVVGNEHEDTSSNPGCGFCISHCTNTLAKCINSTILIPSMDKE